MKNKKGLVVAHTVKVVVTDAGDPDGSAVANVAGHSAQTNGSGVATITVPASVKGDVAVTVNASGGYLTPKTSVHL